MAEIRPFARSATAPGFVLGRKPDSIPFSAYHILIIAVLALVGFIERYDLVMTGSLLVAALLGIGQILPGYGRFGNLC